MTTAVWVKTLRVLASIYKSTWPSNSRMDKSCARLTQRLRVTLQLQLVDAPHLGGSATSTRLPGKRQDSGASQDTFYKMTLQFERKYLTQGSGATCYVSFGFFSGFFGIFLPKLQMDPQPEPTTQGSGATPYGVQFCNRTSISASASRQRGHF
jgi:hypothetical protein